MKSRCSLRHREMCPPNFRKLVTPLSSAPLVKARSTN
jgi:hypothetical protein